MRFKSRALVGRSGITTLQTEDAENDEEILKLFGKQLALCKISEDTYNEQKVLDLKPGVPVVKTKKYNDFEMGYR